MTEPTMEEYITITRINHESGHGRGRIELKGRFLINVSIFPVSLTGAASDWFKDESIGSITKWVDLPDKFFAKFYPPSRVGRKVETNEVNKMILWDAVDTKFENWLTSKIMSYKTMDGCTKNSLWNYWKKDSKLMDNTKMIGFMNGTTRYHGGHSEWPTYGGNFPGAFKVSNMLRYQDYKWYEALEESDLKDEALRNKAALEESMNQEEESSNDDWSHYSPIDEWEDHELDANT
ncbi:hypothetical protein Tco_0958898 [Tanacetum coccineum]